MIWRWLTCFSLAIAGPAMSAARAATVSGTVVLRDSRVDSVNRNKNYSGVVVSLERVGGSSPVADGRHAVMLQKNKMFSPHILTIVTGATVDFPNADPIFHNAFSSYKGQIFDVGLYPPGASRSVRFFRPGVVRVFCNIHPAMSAIILVLNTEFFAATSRTGAFEMNVPPGEYQLSVFHERSGEQALNSLSRRIAVTDEGLRLPAIEVSEAGYVPAPHHNKYGHDYTPAPDDQTAYPGAGK